MTSNEILRADLLDLVFDGRNKAYGAYVLRKFYSSRLTLALGLALATSLLLFLLIGLQGHETEPARSGRDLVVSTIVLPLPPAKPAPPKPIASPRAASVSVPTAKLTSQIRITQNASDMADQNQLKNGLVSTATNDVPFSGDLPSTPPTPIVSAASMPSPSSAPGETLVQREPEFPGGAKAWRTFLERNLQSPAELGAGERQTVVIRFLVSAEGAVTGFEVVQSGGHDYDEEVMRVLRRMPKWKPALVNSQPVARSFTQPVTFVGQE